METTQQQAPKRQCEGTSKKTGQRCTAYAVTGQRFCAGHGSDREHLKAAAKRSVEARQARSKRRGETLKEKLEKGLEARADAIFAAFDRDIELPGGFKNAAVPMMDRVWGKPDQHKTTEDVSDRRLEELSQGELVERLRQYVTDNAN